MRNFRIPTFSLARFNELRHDDGVSHSEMLMRLIDQEWAARRGMGDLIFGEMPEKTVHKDAQVTVRLTANHLLRLSELQRTGWSRSDVLVYLIDLEWAIRKGESLPVIALLDKANQLRDALKLLAWNSLQATGHKPQNYDLVSISTYQNGFIVMARDRFGTLDYHTASISADMKTVSVSERRRRDE